MKYHLLSWVLDTFWFPFFIGISAGGGVSNTDTSFNRKGTSTSSQSHVVPAGLAALLTSLANSSSVPTASTNLQYSALNEILSRKKTDIPHAGVMDSHATMDPTKFTGSSALASLAGVDPMSKDFEASTTDAYKRRVGEAMSTMQSGPGAVRGGTERVPLAQGQAAVSMAEGRGGEVRRAQQEQAGTTISAAGATNSVEAARRQQSSLAQNQLYSQMAAIFQQKLQAAGGVDSGRASSSTALGQATNWLSGGQSSTSDDLSGKGSQGSSHFGGEIGTNCCFIFLQALNGILPWYIDLARRDYYTPERRAGYKWMASWLVPRMAKSTVWSNIVNRVIIKPFLTYGSWLYGAGSKTGWMWAPYCHGWLTLWGGMGKVVK